jgi:twitching motility two-component system response regulator PilG
MSAQALEMLDEAIGAAGRGDRVRARDLLLRVTHALPANEHAWLWLSAVVDDAGEAIEAVRRAVAANPRSAASRSRLKTLLTTQGVAQSRLGQRASARRLFGEAVELDRSDPDLWLWVASTAETPQHARQAVEEVLRIDPAEPRALQWRARLQALQTAVPPNGRAATAAPPPTSRPAVNGAASVAPGSAAEATRRMAPASPPVASRNGNPARVLVVDDSPTVRKIVQSTLAREGWNVLQAENATAALAVLGESVPDLVLLDIGMPEMDGYQLCRLIRDNAATRDVPVVMLSGKDGFFDKVRGRMAGATEYVTKPFKPSSLLATLQRTLAKVG